VGRDPAKGGYDANILKASIALRAARQRTRQNARWSRVSSTFARRGDGSAGYGDVGIKQASRRERFRDREFSLNTALFQQPAATTWRATRRSWDIAQRRQTIDGPVQARKAGGEQLDHGADWFKSLYGRTGRGWIARKPGVATNADRGRAEGHVTKRRLGKEKVASTPYNGIGLQRAADGQCIRSSTDWEMTMRKSRR